MGITQLEKNANPTPPNPSEIAGETVGKPCNVLGSLSLPLGYLDLHHLPSGLRPLTSCSRLTN